VIKQFNFYDIYGYLLPGTLLLGLFWLPVGILTHNWPSQDISNALFMVVLAYITGHLLQTIAISVVPSTVADSNKRQRVPSDLILDNSYAKFGKDFKKRLSKQVRKLFGLALEVAQDGNGEDEISRNRQSAFFQARSYLIAKKSAQYTEQFEGIYGMMRGLGCAFCAGAAYLVGWALSIHGGGARAWCWISVLVCAAIAIALIYAIAAFFHEPLKKMADRMVAASLLLALVGSGYLAGCWRFQPPASFPSYAESVLWGAALLALFAAVRCLAAYRAFALIFAETVWRDFSAYLSCQGDHAASSGGSSEESE
jgi:hypothetical protein